MSHHDHDHEHECGCGCEESLGNSIILFQGDSITDCGRDYSDPMSLGTGYAMMIAAQYQAKHPELPIDFMNRGISGNRTCDLKSRWEEDCLDIEPELLTILIGVNDTWRRYDSNSITSAAEFEDNYTDILERTVETLDCGIVLMEPFILPTPEDRETWREDLDPKIHIVRKLARDFGATLVPLDGIFAQAAAKREPESWAADGVHPTLAGHALIAQAWLDTVGIML